MTPPAYHAHPQYRALLAAVRAAPEDDLPRLVLADWLEENGYAERAELIRVQCAPLATVPCGQVEHPLADFPDLEVGCLDFMTALDDPAPHWCSQCRSRHRATQLAGRLGAEFGDPDVLGMAEPFRGNGLTAALCVSYTRGVVVDVRGPFPVWLTHAARVLPESVGLTVRLTDWPLFFGWTAEYGWADSTSTDWGIPDHDAAERMFVAKARYRWPEVARWELSPHQFTISGWRTERDFFLRGSPDIGRPQGVVDARHTAPT